MANNNSRFGGPDFDKVVHFLSICVLAFINEGSSSLSTAFMNEPWSWGLSIPISLYVKFALEIHTHLGLCVGVGVPSLVYWGATRGAVDWYWESAKRFNHEVFKTCLFNVAIGLLHFLVSKLAHYVIEWVRDHKLANKNHWLCELLLFAKLDLEAVSRNPLLRPIALKTLVLKLVELLLVFFCNGNVLLLCWCFSGNLYSYEVGKAISWVGLGSSMFVWIKSLFRELGEMQEEELVLVLPPHEQVFDEEKQKKKPCMKKDNYYYSSIDENVETKEEEDDNQAMVICSTSE